MDLSVEILKLVLLETGRYEVNLTLDGATKSSTLYVEANVQLASLPKFQFTVPDQEQNGGGTLYRKLRVKLSLNDRNTIKSVLYGEGETFFCLPASSSNSYYSSPPAVRSALGRISKVVSTPCKVVQIVLTVPSLNIMSLKKYRGRVWLKFNTPFDTSPIPHRPIRIVDDEVSVEDTPPPEWEGLPRPNVHTPSSDGSFTSTQFHEESDTRQIPSSQPPLPSQPSPSSQPPPPSQPAPSSQPPSLSQPPPPSQPAPSSQPPSPSQSPPLSQPPTPSQPLPSSQHPPSSQPSPSPQPPSPSQTPPVPHHPPSGLPYSNVESSTPSARPMGPNSIANQVGTSTLNHVSYPYTPSMNHNDTPTVNHVDTTTSTQPDTSVPVLAHLNRSSPQPLHQLRDSGAVKDTISCAVQTEQDWMGSNSEGQGRDDETTGKLGTFRYPPPPLGPTELPSLRTVVTSLLDQDRLDEGGVSLLGGGVAPPDTNDDVLRTLAAELRDYKEANSKLGEEISLLRTEEEKLKKEIQFYKKMAAPVVPEEFSSKNGSKVVDELKHLTKGDLYLKSLELHSQCTTLTQQLVAYRDKVTLLQNSLIVQNDRESEFLQLQKAHTDQQQILLNLQSKVEKLKKFEETCVLQETIITKLEELVTSQASGHYNSDATSKVYKVLAEENKRLRERVNVLESHVSRKKLQPAPSSTTPQQQVEYLSRLKQISSQCDSLEVKLNQLNRDSAGSSTDSHLLQLEQKLILTTSELEAVKEHLQANVSSWAEERAHYNTVISQLEAKLKHLQIVYK